MKPGRSARLRTETLAAYLEGELSPKEGARVEVELRYDAEARGRLEQLGQIRSILRAPLQEFSGTDLVASVHRALEEPESSRRQRAKPWFLLGGAVAVAAGVALSLTRLASPVRDTEFQKRSAGAMSDQTRWAGIRVYRVRETQATEPLGERLSRGDGLLFAYTNLGSQPFAYLMVFGVGAAGQVHWFHPAYERLGSDPQSVLIEQGRAEVTLNEVVRHNYAVGPLVIYALFSRRPFDVLEIEAWLQRQQGSKPVAPPAADASLQAVRVEVE